MKGSIQTARKILPRVFASALPLSIKLQALLHLTANAGYALMLVLATLLIPVVAAPEGASFRPTVLLELLVLGLGLGARHPVPARGAAGLRWFAVADRLEVAAAAMLGMGLSLNNTRAVLEGLGSTPWNFERTPKRGDHSSRARRALPVDGRGRDGIAELVLALGFAGIGVFAWNRGHAQSLPFIVLLLSGLLFVGLVSLRGATGAAAEPLIRAGRCARSAAAERVARVDDRLRVAEDASTTGTTQCAVAITTQSKRWSCVGVSGSARELPAARTRAWARRDRCTRSRAPRSRSVSMMSSDGLSRVSSMSRLVGARRAPAPSSPRTACPRWLRLSRDQVRPTCSGIWPFTWPASSMKRASKPLARAFHDR